MFATALLIVGLVAFGWSARGLQADGDALEDVTTAGLLTVTVVAVLSLALARLEQFSVGTIGALLTIGAIGLRARSATGQRDRLGPLGWGVLGAVAAWALFNAEYPTYYLFGGRDPGVYYVFTEWIYRSGGLTLDVPVLADLHAIDPEAIHAGYPGIYSAYDRGLSDDITVLQPQFAHLFPALAANAAAFGQEAVVRVNVIIGSLALLATFDLARKLLRLPEALVVTSLLAINPAIVWASRITLTEPLALLLVMWGASLVHRTIQPGGSVGLGRMAGLVLGVGVLNRLDASFAVVVLAGATAVVPSRPSARAPLQQALLVYLAASSVGFLDVWAHSRPYWIDLWDAGQVSKLVALNYGACFAGLAVLQVPWRRFGEGRVTGLTTGVLKLGAAGLAGWLTYDWFVRSLDITTFEARCIRELAWYTTPGLFVTSAMGAWVAASRGRRDWAPILVLGGLTIFAFTWRPSISADHVWASRRWIPYTIPTMLLLSGLAVQELRLTYPKLRTAVVAAALLGSGWYAQTAYEFSRPWLTRSVLKELPGEYRRLIAAIERVPKGALVISEDAQVASVLNYVYGIPTVLSNGRANRWSDETARRLSGSVLISRPPINSWGEPIAFVRLGGLFPDRTRGSRPERLVPVNSRLTVSALWPPIEQLPPPRLFGTDSLWSSGRTHPISGSVMIRKGGGTVNYGPYTHLGRGDYRITWYGTSGNAAPASGHVFNRRGEVRVSQADTRLVPMRRTGRIAFIETTIPTDLVGGEFKLSASEEAAHVRVQWITAQRLELLRPRGPVVAVPLGQVAASVLPTHDGERDESTGVLRNGGKDLMLQYGPYATLEPGTYQVDWIGTASAPGRVTGHVHSNEGSHELGHGTTDVLVSDEVGVLASFEFKVSEREEFTEFKLRTHLGVAVELHAVRWHRIYELENAVERSFPTSRLATTGAVIEQGKIHMSGDGRAEQFGPYEPLEPGRYVAVWRGEAITEGSIRLDAAAEEGQRLLAEARTTTTNLSPGTLGTLVFDLDKAVQDAEFRLVSEDAELLIESVQIYEVRGDGVLP